PAVPPTPPAAETPAGWRPRSAARVRPGASRHRARGSPPLWVSIGTWFTEVNAAARDAPHHSRDAVGLPRSHTARYSHLIRQGRRASRVQRRLLLPSCGSVELPGRHDQARVRPAVYGGVLRRMVLARATGMLELGLRRMNELGPPTCSVR